MRELDFVHYNEAIALKELGFDDSCVSGYYNKDVLYTSLPNKSDFNNSKRNIVSRPMFYQAFSWFRERYSIEPQIKSWKENGGVVWHYSVQRIGEPSVFRSIDCAASSYEEAQLSCLRKLIEIVKQTQKKQ